MSVTGAIPAVTRDLVRFANASRGEDDRFRVKNLEMAALTLVPERSDHSTAILQQRDDANLHMYIDSAMYPVVLQRPDHFEPGTVAHMREPWIFVAAEVSLQNTPVLRAIEDCAPGFELAHTSGRFFCVQLGHAPVVHVLTAAHRIREMHLPIVAIVNIGQCRGDAAFRH